MNSFFASIVNQSIFTERHQRHEAAARIHRLGRFEPPPAELLRHGREQHRVESVGQVVVLPATSTAPEFADRADCVA